jgi:hypothetical protein
MTAWSSQAFMLVRSVTSTPGSASLISSKSGPEKVRSATVARIVATPKARAAWAISATLFRSSIASIDDVANAICGWWSTSSSV